MPYKDKEYARERSREYNRRWYAKNKEKRKFQIKGWQETNKEKRYERQREYEKENKDKINKKKREYHMKPEINYRNKIRRKTNHKYGRLKRGFVYHHNTNPYQTDRFMILERGFHNYYHKNPDKFKMRGRL